jgi:hypothetical protein
LGFSEDLFLANLSQSFSSKFDCWAYDFVWTLLSRFPLHRFAAYAIRQQTPFYADCVGTTSYVADVCGPSAHSAVLTVKYSVFSAFEEFTFRKTFFIFSQGSAQPTADIQNITVFFTC